MNKYYKRREHIESIIKEQLIGPGSFNKRFFFLSKWRENEFHNKKLESVLALNNDSELIPLSPAVAYSTGILFPRTEIDTSLKEKEESIETKEEDEEIIDSNDSESLKDLSSDSAYSKNQNYPNTFGLSFVIQNKENWPTELSAYFNCRTYTNNNKSSRVSNQLSIWLKTYTTELKNIIQDYLGSIFEIVDKDSNQFLIFKKPNDTSKELFYEIDYSLMNKLKYEYLLNYFYSIEESEVEKKIEENKMKIVSKNNGNTLFTIYNKNKLGYENILYPQNSNLINYCIEARDSNPLFLKFLERLELFNQLEEYINQMKSVFKKDSFKNELWESKTHSIEIKFPYKRLQKGTFRASEIIEFNNFSFKTHFQYIFKSDKIFIRLIIENLNSCYVKQNQIHRLNTITEVNSKCFFGSKLVVQEKQKELILPYQDFRYNIQDEEESLNKLLYRNLRDYGEGYNCSINWNIKDYIRIETDFLPEQETPDVDVKPSEISEGKVKSILSNSKVLSFRFLSTLSETSESEIIENLNEFIDKYGVYWLSKKRAELEQEGLDSKSKLLLNKQLNACENDYRRLKRNINLLKTNPEGMLAFRVMNTAMFMQLHHGISVKAQDSPFTINQDNLEKYYSSVLLEEEYQWRPFQLGFILLNIDAFIEPNDLLIPNIFNNNWPERNEIADLVWFPTGGGKTEAYLGLIAFMISLRRITKPENGGGTSVLMRYTLRMLTTQQFNRASLLICALEVIRNNDFYLGDFSLGDEKITIGLYVGSDSLPNNWEGLRKILEQISEQIENNITISTKLPFLNCPWCGGELFRDETLKNINPNHKQKNYKPDDEFLICCNTSGCSFHSRRPSKSKSLPLRVFDVDIYKYPPTLLFGTVDKFASLANKVSSSRKDIGNDSSRLFGTGFGINNIPPELIIQDELHLLLGPLGSAVGLYERSIDYLCTYKDLNERLIKPKIITSTATTRNTDKQIFALFNRRTEIFPKQGILAEDSFFSWYKRKPDNITLYSSKRKYLGILPVGRTQVWMQLRVEAICLAERSIFLSKKYTISDFLNNNLSYDERKVLDYYHTTLAYFNSLKEVGKTQSHLHNYLPNELNIILENTSYFTIIDSVLRASKEIKSSELTGRLNGEEVKMNTSEIETPFDMKGQILKTRSKTPELVIATNMISVGIDISKFNLILINSMPRNIAEYIQASSRVARSKPGIVFTIHHPFKSRDISHYQKFKEFHEKFYSYVEPISITPFANKAIDRYLSMYLAVMIRHNKNLELRNNSDAKNLDENKILIIKKLIGEEFRNLNENAEALSDFLSKRPYGVTSNVVGIISKEEINYIEKKVSILLEKWLTKIHEEIDSPHDINYRPSLNSPQLSSVFGSEIKNQKLDDWRVSYSLREIGASTAIKTVQQ